MNWSRILFWRIWLVLLTILAFHIGPFAAQAKTGSQPQVVFWSWYHDDDLRAAPGAVASLTNRIFVDGTVVKDTPRLNRLRLKPHTSRIAVVRIDVKALPPKDKQGVLVNILVERILASTVRGRGVLSGLQIDYDATLDQRQFYAQLLDCLRKRMPHGLPLSTTALASWCMADQWLSQAHLEKQVDFFVPMLFTMGDGRQSALSYLQKYGLKSPGGPLCAGFSLDDPEPLQVMINSGKFSQVACVYFFSSKPWNQVRVIQALHLLAKGKNCDSGY